MTPQRDLGKTALRDLTKEDVAYCHLSRRGWEYIDGHTLYTSLEQIEMEMRQARSIKNTSSYVPLLAAFSILEQLGDTYEDKRLPKHPANGGGIERALYFFAGFAPMGPEVKALKALRNGLVHSASLISNDAATNERYLFRYSENIGSALKLPDHSWDGQLSTISPRIMTVINPRRLTDLVSDAIENVRSLLFVAPGQLRIRRTARAILVCHLFWRW